MLTGELRSKIDRIWDGFWSGGISNPLEVMEQITYLLFIKRLDDLHTLEENRASRLGEPMARSIFPEGSDGISHDGHKDGRPYADLRWSRFKHLAPAEMHEVVGEHVFPFLRTLGGEGSTYATHMKDARYTIPSAALVRKAVDGLDEVPIVDRDTKGDVYEYMLGKIASAGQNGQFRTPRHIIQLMVEMVAPTPTDVICDPACGTCGFLVAAGEYVRHRHPEALRDEKLNRHFHHEMFNGFDFDNTMLRIGSMNMLLHGVEQPDVRYRDSLAQGHAGVEETYSVILANPPFAGSLDYENTAKDLQRVVKTKKTELLFLALFLRLLKPGGRAAVIVPDGVLFGSSKAHKELRRILVEDQRLDGIVSLPSGAFKPYAGVSTAILLFTKTNSGGTDNVWFYDLTADGYSLDDRRTPLLPPVKLGATPAEPLTDDEHAKNNLPDARAHWAERAGTERHRARTDQSFCVPEGGHRRRRLRPQHQPVQGDRPQGDRPPLPAGDPEGACCDRRRHPTGPGRPRNDAVTTAWPEVALGDLMASKSRSVDPTNTLDETFELYSIPAFDAGVPEIVTGSAIGSTKQALEPGDVLLSRIVPHIRRVWPVGRGEGFRKLGSSEWIVFRTDRALPRYLRHLLANDRVHAEFMRTVSGVGGSLLRARPSLVAEIRVPLPPVDEQRRIAEILDAADELRAKRRASLALLDCLTESIFLDLFGDPTVNAMNWRMVPLASACILAGEYGAGVASAPDDRELPRYVRITDIREDGALNAASVSPAGNPDSWARYLLAQGDVLFARSGATVGKAYLHRQVGRPHVFAGYLIRFRPDRAVLTPEFLFAFTRTQAYRSWVQQCQRTVAQPNINAKQYGTELEIPLPPIDLQRQFEEKITRAREVGHRALVGQAKLDSLFSSLQHRAFRGEL